MHNYDMHVKELNGIINCYRPILTNLNCKYFENKMYG